MEPWEVHCEFRVGSKRDEVPWQTVERLVRRYAIMETTNRAVILLDIVGFSKLTSIQRIAQLNSLEYSINISQRLLQQNGLSVELAKSTTGDGFYIWNRETGAMPNIALFIILTFILADNALCKTKDTKSFVPLLRAAFSIGTHLSYHQIEGMMPRGYDYIVGDVTISLARLIEKAHSKQILIGDFKDTSGEAHTATDTVEFIQKIKRLIRKFHGVSLGNTPISDLQLSLTGSEKTSGQTQPSHSSPKKYTITDKHGLKHHAYNVHIAVERAGTFPLYLGNEAAMAGH